MSFTYQWRRSGTPISGATAPTYTLVTADIGALITVAVTATGPGGTSSPAISSSTAAVIGAYTVPGAPTIGAATGGDASATINGTAPSNNGGTAIDGYRAIPYIGSTAGTPGPVSSTLPATIPSGLVNGTAYTFKLQARNSVGWSLESAASNSVTPTASVVLPGAPTIVGVTPGDATVSGVWVAPSSSGSSAITNYRLTWSGGQIAVVGNVLSGAVTGVTNGTSGTLTVAASNNGGSTYGPESAASSTVTPQAESEALRIVVSAGLGAPSSPGNGANSAGYKQFNSQGMLQNNAGVAIKDGTLRLKFVNGHTDLAGGGYMVNAPACSYQVGVSPKVANGSVANGSRTLLTFGGQTTYAATAGEEFWSDPITFGSDMAIGDLFRVNVYADFVTAPPVVPAANYNATSNEYDLSEGAVSGLASKATSTGKPASRISPKRILMPCTMTGEPVGGARVRKGILLIGDSITSGADDTATGLRGFAQKGVSAPLSTVSNTWVQASTEGYAYVTMMADANRRRLTLSPADGCNVAVCFLNVNDIRSGQSSAQIRANMVTLKSALAAKGVSRLIVSTCFTNTNGSNGDPGGGIWTRLNQLNADIIANNGIGDGYFDINAITRDPANPNQWKPGYTAADGTHPTPSMHDLLAAGLGSFLDTLSVN